ncbi:hypothetical protein D9M73_65190 [compost metagenome]
MKRIATFACLALHAGLSFADKYGVDEALADGGGSGGANGAIFIIIGAVAGFIYSEAKNYQTTPCVVVGGVGGLFLGWVLLALV